MAPAKSAELKDRAATAALYVTKGKGDQAKKSDNYPLDEHGKLSAAGAASSLKHANPTDLPSYPIVGLENTESSAGAAASLANKNQKTFEHWKPGEIPAANKAATLAKDYKPAPLWQPKLSAAGSKAALLAAKEGGDVKIWRPESTDAGHSAAGQAMRKKGLSPQLDYGHTPDGERRAMMAATGAMSDSRKRAGSTPTAPPVAYPDSANSAANALKAATSANRPGKPKAVPPKQSGPVINAGRIHNAAVTNLSREMYTANPPVAPELEEQKRQAGLRAAAVSMAKQMYDVQQKHIEDAAALRRSDSHYAATSVHNRPQSVASTDDGHQAPQYVNLQEAAQKLAAERLAKLHDEHAAYRTYYGTQAAPQSHKLSIRGRNRGRTSSDGQGGESDEERSKQIRNEMSLFTDKLAQVDNKKRQKDRDSLLAAAQRNVRASMHGMDERVFNDTGKMSPAMTEEWEAKARAKATAESESRMVNHGKVNIGGGKYLDQSEVDAIAAAKVQPTLDEIAVTAEKHRERDEELRQQQLERERIAREKEADQNERDTKTKEDWRLFKEEEKREARARKAEERARRTEERRLRDEEKRKSRDAKATAAVPVAVAIETTKEQTVEEDGEAVMLGPEPPEMELTTHVASIVPTEIKSEPLVGEETRVAPTFIPITEKEPINASQANLQPTPIVEPVPVPTEISEPTETPVEDLSHAERVAKRVFSSPVENETVPSTAVDVSTREIEEKAEATADTVESPVVAAESTIAPATGEGPMAVAAVPTAMTEAVRTTDPEIPILTNQPVALPTATTETVVSGPDPSKPPKEKDSGKVSSWLKTKFSRRASRTIKPESNTDITDGKEKGFIGGASLTAPEASNTGSDHGESSMREVAMAGKENTAKTTLTAPSPGDHPIVSPASADDELYAGSSRQPATGEAARESTSSPSISSLSSDEDTRGRSAIRLADQIGAPANIATTGPSEGFQSEPMDPILPRQSASSAGVGDEFEEARDTFDSEKLDPPGVIGGSGRASDSPARDSKFVEVL